MNILNTLNNYLQNAGLDTGSLLLLIAILGALMFFTQNYKFGLVMTLLLLLVVYLVQKVLILQTATTILLILVVVVIMAITLYLAEKGTNNYT